MSQCLEDLLQQCTVKLTIPGFSQGTGFFVSPGLILTCAHVVKGLEDKSIQVRWQNQENWAQAVVERLIPDPHDLALLRVASLIDVNPPCVFLDAKVPKQRDPLYLFGYPDKDFYNGCPVTFDYEGLTGDDPVLIKFKSGLVRPGMSGSPLLNQRTGDVCGIVKFTLDRSSVRGGGAIPTSVILNQFPELIEKQRSFHLNDRRWSNLAEELFDDEAEMRQSNFDNTTNYQVRTGDNSNNIIGGEHQHYYASSQGKQIAKNILILPANPDNTEISHKRIGIQKLRDALKRANHGQLFKLEDRLETSAVDIAQVLTEIEPYIVNISGHEDGVESIALKDKSNNQAKLIADLFRHRENNIKCVVLQGCYSENQAREIVRHIEYVIGISQELGDNTVIDFLVNFYYHLGSSWSIEQSYDQSFNHLQRNGTEYHLLPVILNKYDEQKRKDIENDLKLCMLELEKDRNDVKIWTKKADLLSKLDRPDEANEAYEQASKIQPENSEIRTKQGEILRQSGNYEGAIIAYDKALKLDEDYKVLWKKGQALVEIKKYFEAAQSYDRAVELNPPSPDSYMIFREYGFILKELGQHQKSIIKYSKSLGIEPRYRVSSYEKRQVYKKMYFGAD